MEIQNDNLQHFVLRLPPRAVLKSLWQRRLLPHPIAPGRRQHGLHFPHPVLNGSHIVVNLIHPVHYPFKERRDLQ
jgi:hypothetical protein